MWPRLLGVLLVAAAASRSSPTQHGGGVPMDTSTGQPPNFTSPHWPFDQCPPFPTPYAHDDYPVNYSYTGTFPKDFIWGLGTAAYQVCSFPRSLAPSLRRSRLRSRMAGPRATEPRVATIRRVGRSARGSETEMECRRLSLEERFLSMVPLSHNPPLYIVYGAWLHHAHTHAPQSVHPSHPASSFQLPASNSSQTHPAPSLASLPPTCSHCPPRSRSASPAAPHRPPPDRGRLQRGRARRVDLGHFYGGEHEGDAGVGLQGVSVRDQQGDVREGGDG